MVLIAMEGIPDAGKTSVGEELITTLQSRGLHAVFIEEVGRGDLADYPATQLRHFFSTLPVGRMRSFLLLDRRIQQYEVIARIQKEETDIKIVVMDRSWQSVVVDIDVMAPRCRLLPRDVTYQKRLVYRKLKEIMGRDPIPDLTLFLRVSLEKARKRKKRQYRKGERLLLSQMAERYEELAAQQRRKQKWISIDADRPFQEVVSQCVEAVTKMFPV